ncbi:MAG: acyl-ACP--UDP-N-acetylglucosamine O-acyltransferase, partial [Muribaculaceae bacterium]|nr:acyl-ACP--UDP-N-acetylglucosamine O-acyltransferase [Muribaculaceae bacterium]
RLSSGVTLHEGSSIGRCVLVKGGTRISSNVPPFVIMAHNPVSYYGVNAIIMRKHAGFSEEQIDDIAKAYRHIYQSTTSVFNALRRIEADIDQSEVRDEIMDFVRSHDLKLAGHRVELD